MYGRKLGVHHSILTHSMVVRHFDIVSITFLPPEANSPLVVDADAMLSGTIPRKSVQAIGRWYT